MTLLIAAAFGADRLTGRRTVGALVNLVGVAWIVGSLELALPPLILVGGYELMTQPIGTIPA
jgi:hypothetical protein